MASESYILGMIISVPCRTLHSDFKKGVGGMWYAHVWFGMYMDKYVACVCKDVDHRILS